MHFQSALDSHVKRKPVTVGHRGNNKYAPENTRISYVQAVEVGTPILEFDTALTKDGHIVGLHDKTLDRTTDGVGPVAEMTLEQVRKFEAGSWKDPKYQGEPIPTLDEVADIARGKAVLMLDLKAEGQGQALAAWLEKSNFPRDQVLLAPWTDEEGSALRQHVKDVPMIRLTSKVPTERFDKAYFDRMKQIGFSGFSVNWQYLSQAFTDAAHKNGMAVFVWSIVANPEIAGATLLGADGIITDDPASTMKTVQALQSR
jgi:glycerophosphoryl diester phosphodiesterase